MILPCYRFYASKYDFALTSLVVYWTTNCIHDTIAPFKLELISKSEQFMPFYNLKRINTLISIQDESEEQIGQAQYDIDSSAIIIAIPPKLVTMRVNNQNNLKLTELYTNNPGRRWVTYMDIDEQGNQIIGPPVEYETHLEVMVRHHIMFPVTVLDQHNYPQKITKGASYETVAMATP
jgi:hypothetical protein